MIVVRARLRSPASLVAVVAGLALLAGCTLLPATPGPLPEPTGAPPARFPTASVTAETPRRGGTLTVVLPDEPRVLNPRRSDCDAPCQATAAAIFESLLVPGDNGYVVGVLSTNWTMPDQQTMTLRLRGGVTFHDGSALTSAVVRTSLEGLGGAATNGPWRRVWAEQVERVDAPDAMNVSVKLRRPFAPLLSLLASPQAAIVGAANPDGFLPVGSGPYRLAAGAPAGDVLERNPGWWRKDAAFLDALRFVVEPDPAVQRAALQSGAAGVVAASVSAAGARTIAEPGWNTASLLFDTRRAPFDDGGLRRDISRAIDRVALAGRAGVGPATGSAISPGQWQYDPSTVQQGFDTAASSAVRGRGVSASLAYPATAAGRQLAEAVGAELQRAGLRTALDPRPAGDYGASLAAGYQLALWVPAPPFASFDSYYSWWRLFLPGGLTGYRSPAFEAAVGDAVGARIRDEQLPHWQRAAAILVADAPAAFLLASQEGSYSATAVVSGLSLAAGYPSWNTTWLSR